MTEIKEQWRRIQDQPKYEVSNFGNVRHAITHRPRYARIPSPGRPPLISLDGECRQLANLVGEVWLPDKPANYCTPVECIDGDLLNVHISNLRWTKTMAQKEAEAEALLKERDEIERMYSK